MTSFAETYLEEAAAILAALDRPEIERMARELAEVREGGGRLFILGVGGSAAHASHAVNDFRKLCGFEAYAPTDSVSELTARVNDEGWEASLSGWLRASRLGGDDAILVLSVGGGSRQPSISANIVDAITLARRVGASVFGIVGRDGGVTRLQGRGSILIPPLVAERITPHTEGVCAVVWHLLVSHPALRTEPAKWESAMPEVRR